MIPRIRPAQTKRKYGGVKLSARHQQPTAVIPESFDLNFSAMKPGNLSSNGIETQSGIGERQVHHHRYDNAPT